MDIHCLLVVFIIMAALLTAFGLCLMSLFFLLFDCSLQIMEIAFYAIVGRVRACSVAHVFTPSFVLSLLLLAVLASTFIVLKPVTFGCKECGHAFPLDNSFNFVSFCPFSPVQFLAEHICMR